MTTLVLLSVGNSQLAVTYRQDEIDTFSVIENNETKSFDLSKIWVNNHPPQPACDLKKFQKLDESMVRGFEISNGELKLFLTISIKIEGLGTFKVSPDLTILGLKELLTAKNQWELENIQIYNEKGTSCFDNIYTLQECGIKDQSKLTVEVTKHKPKTFGTQSQEFGSLLFNDTQQPVSRDSDPTAPEWRVYDKGLNLQGQCNNPACEANGEKVLVQMKMGTFSIRKWSCEVKCPLLSCGQKLSNVTNCYFSDCTYTIEGTLYYNRPIPVITETAPRDHYVTFEEATGVVNWEYLKITTKPFKSIFTRCVLL